MSVETDFYTAVTGDATTAAIISTRLYPVEIPDDATFPALAYSVISQTPFAKTCLETRLQVDMFAASYATVKSLRDALVNLNESKSNWLYIGGPDALETDEGLFHQSIDMTIIHSV